MRTTSLKDYAVPFNFQVTAKVNQSGDTVDLIDSNGRYLARVERKDYFETFEQGKLTFWYGKAPGNHLAAICDGDIIVD